MRRIAVRPLVLSLLLIGLAGRLEAHSPLSPETQGPQPYRISVNVHLVLLNASVRDAKGQFAAGLREQDFAIYEDGIRQTVRLFQHEDIPVTVGLVVDHSGSMRPKLTDVIGELVNLTQRCNKFDLERKERRLCLKQTRL